jgi:hypothetical protein
MKTFTFSCFVLLLLTLLYSGCKDDSTSPTQITTPGVDFSISYTISGDTCWFYFTPNEDVRLDSIKAEYQAQSYSEVYPWPWPEERYVKGSTYLFFVWWFSMPRPANWKFTFWGRKYSDNSNYTVTKSFTVP